MSHLPTPSLTAEAAVAALAAATADRWRAGRGSLGERLARGAQAAIRCGGWPAGVRLPAERALAPALGVSRTTVVAAWEVLREEGWVESRRGSGSYVKPLAGGAETAAGPLPAEPLPVAADRLAATALTRAPVAAARMAAHLSESERPGGARIDLLGAHMEAAQPFVEEELAAATADLRRHLAHHGYLGYGLPELREAIAAHLTARGLPSDADQVLVTSGAQQAIGLVASLYVQPGDAVALEDPTYLGAIDALAAARARLVAIPAAALGGGLDRLREVIARHAPRLIYVIPSFHNPTGATMSAAQRRELALLAAETGTPVLEDLTLADLDLGAPPPPPVGAALPGAPVLTAGSLGKLVWGGLRIGWVRAEAPVIARLARQKVIADVGSSVPSQLLAARLLPRAPAVRDARRRQLRERLGTLEAALAAELPDWSWRRPDGGLVLWVRLPRGGAADLARLALGQGVAIVPGPTCSPRNAWENHVRLPFVLPPEELREAVSRLARAWSVYAPAHAAGAGRGRPAPLVSPPPPPLDVLV